MGFQSLCLLPILILVRVETVPPEACFANFNWDDCGKVPVPVMYYWKPGSRCEVALWRGCLPNLNMFSDEYECVTTCIFAARAMPVDYHSINENEIEEKTEFDIEVTTEGVNGTEKGIKATAGIVTIGGDIGNANEAVTVTLGGEGSGGDSNAAVAGDKATTSGGDGNATVAGDKVTTVGDEAGATTAAAT